MIRNPIEKSDNDLHDKHGNVIRIINKNKRLRKFPAETAPLRNALLQFIKDINNDICSGYTSSKPGMDLALFMKEKSFIQIFWRAKELLTYRAFLGKLKKDCPKPTHYLQVAQSSDIAKEMKAGNIYIIHENLIHLYNFIQYYDGLNASGQANVMNLYGNPSELILKELYALTEYIEKLRDDTQPMKLYLQSLAAYTVAQLYSSKLANANDSAIVVQEALKNVFIAARMGEIYTDRHSSPSTSSYKVQIFDPEKQSIIDELTLGQGLFSRIPANSFTEMHRHVASLGVLTGPELTVCMDKAKKEFEKSFPDTSDAYKSSNPESLKRTAKTSYEDETPNSEAEKKWARSSRKR